mgnify:CR=1 FL=1
MFDLIRSLTKWKGSEQRTKEFKRISEQLGMTFSARVKGRAKDRATPPLPLFGEGRSRVVTNMLHGDSELLGFAEEFEVCLLYTSPSPRDGLLSRMPSSA